MASSFRLGTGFPIKATPLVVASLLWLTPASADIVRPGDPVVGRRDVTYLDLLRLVVPDLDAAQSQEEAKGSQIVAYRHIEGPGARTSPAGAMWISGIEPLPVHVDGKTRLAILVDLGPSADGYVAEFSLLALFDVGARPKLLDVVEVGRDRETGFAIKPLRPLGGGSDLILVATSHSDADISFDGEELLFARGDHFQFVAAFSTFARNDNCKFRLLPDQKVTTSPDPGSPYRRISLVVRERLSLKPGPADCDEQKPPKPFSRVFRATYRWDLVRQSFSTDSKDVERLSKEVASENDGQF
jgi:hypothetical protein